MGHSLAEIATKEAAALLAGRSRFIGPPLPDSQTEPCASRQTNRSDRHVHDEERNEVERVVFIGDELPFGEVVAEAMGAPVYDKFR
jgi:hypothetical protein